MIHFLRKVRHKVRTIFQLLGIFRGATEPAPTDPVIFCHILKGKIDPKIERKLQQGLDAYGQSLGAPSLKMTPLSILAHDEKGALVGGLTGQTFGNWLYIDLLWVSEESRGQGIGGTLVTEAEKLAKARGCHAAYLWTQTWEAPDFYAKRGYTRFIDMDNFPNGFQRIGFRKHLGKSVSGEIPTP